jgi:hypothetical protein
MEGVGPLVAKPIFRSGVQKSGPIHTAQANMTTYGSVVSNEAARNAVLALDGFGHTSERVGNRVERASILFAPTAAALPLGLRGGERSGFER